MECPFCGEDSVSVVETRPLPHENALRRRRQCASCSKRFTTYERIEAEELRVIKKDGRRERFDPEKVRKGILIAVEKRPVTTQQIDEAIDRIERELRCRDESEVQSTLIGELVMKELRAMDTVGYLRFASIYKDFAGLEEFVTEIKSIAPHITLKRK